MPSHSVSWSAQKSSKTFMLAKHCCKQTTQKNKTENISCCWIPYKTFWLTPFMYMRVADYKFITCHDSLFSWDVMSHFDTFCQFCTTVSLTLTDTFSANTYFGSDLKNNCSIQKYFVLCLLSVNDIYLILSAVVIAASLSHLRRKYYSHCFNHFFQDSYTLSYSCKVHPTYGPIV